MRGVSLVGEYVAADGGMVCARAGVGCCEGGRRAAQGGRGCACAYEDLDLVPRGGDDHVAARLAARGGRARDDGLLRRRVEGLHRAGARDGARVVRAAVARAAVVRAAVMGAAVLRAAVVRAAVVGAAVVGRVDAPAARVGGVGRGARRAAGVAAGVGVGDAALGVDGGRGRGERARGRRRGRAGGGAVDPAGCATGHGMRWGRWGAGTRGWWKGVGAGRKGQGAVGKYNGRK